MRMLKFFPLSLVAISFVSCSKESISSANPPLEDDTPQASLQPNIQVVQYASLYSGLLQDAGVPDSKANTKSMSRTLDNIDVLVEGGDTLMYALNYKDNGGYILVGADFSVSPILAHSSSGSFNFDTIEEGNPASSFLESYKAIIKERRSNGGMPNSEFYDNWKDLGKDGYEYEVTACSFDEALETKTTRGESSKKAVVYPFTGEELVYWCQDGGYNYYAENKARIGCPAIAIGMLMYDTSNRVTGNSQTTIPGFSYYYDAFDASGYTVGTPVAENLRQIADAIPNYRWGKSELAESGASANDIVSGLHNLGYTNAVVKNYDFETLYKNLSFTGRNYFGELTTFYRGVLLLGFTSPYPGAPGHIWFCDGYYEQSYTVTKKFLGITINSWTEYDDRLYMNWGWGPNGGNGWYCATDEDYSWSSWDNESVGLRYAPSMIVNLDTYVNPKEN